MLQGLAGGQLGVQAGDRLLNICVSAGKSLNLPGPISSPLTWE